MKLKGLIHINGSDRGRGGSHVGIVEMGAVAIGVVCNGR